MTQTLQPGQHPDAEQLGAFAEHALPPHEQQQLLAHLAACSDCRALVFLAQEAVPAAAILPQPVAAHKPWFSLFSGWKLAVPAAAALACLVLVTVHLHNQAMEDRMNRMIDKTARLDQAPPPAPPPPAQPAPLKTTPAEAPKPLAIAAPSASRLVTGTAATGTAAGAASFHGNTQPLGLGGLGGRGAAVSTDELKAASTSHQSSFGMTNFTAGNPASAPAAAPGAAALSGSLGGPLPQASVLAADTSADQAVANAAATPLRPVPSTATALHSLNQQYSAVPPLPPPPPQPQTATPSTTAGLSAGIGSVTQTVSVSSAAAQIETESTASSGVISGAALGSLQSNKARMAENRMAKKQPTLPSNRPVLATASNAGQQLALDTAGALFRTEDAGVTWHPVAVQWTGRAVKIAVAPSPTPPAPAKDALSTATPASAAAKAAPAKAPFTPPQLFQLTNDAGQLWTSPDGQTWKHQ